MSVMADKQAAFPHRRDEHPTSCAREAQGSSEAVLGNDFIKQVQFTCADGARPEVIVKVTVVKLV